MASVQSLSFFGAFQAMKGFPLNIFFNTSAFGVHPSVTCITLHLNGYIKVYVCISYTTLSMHVANIAIVNALAT